GLIPKAGVARVIRDSDGGKGRSRPMKPRQGGLAEHLFGERSHHQSRYGGSDAPAGFRGGGEEKGKTSQAPRQRQEFRAIRPDADGSKVAGVERKIAEQQTGEGQRTAGLRPRRQQREYGKERLLALREFPPEEPVGETGDGAHH